ncbi:hypothetical protein ACQZV8_11470 [Magnetococcales bacterium HHB-1]
MSVQKTDRQVILWNLIIFLILLFFVLDIIDLYSPPIGLKKNERPFTIIQDWLRPSLEQEEQKRIVDLVKKIITIQKAYQERVGRMQPFIFNYWNPKHCTLQKREFQDKVKKIILPKELLYSEAFFEKHHLNVGKEQIDRLFRFDAYFSSNKKSLILEVVPNPIRLFDWDDPVTLCGKNSLFGSAFLFTRNISPFYEEKIKCNIPQSGKVTCKEGSHKFSKELIKELETPQK